MNLSQRRCTPCDAGTPRVDAARVRALMPELPGWEVLDDGGKLHRRFGCADFRGAMAFVMRLALLAEGQDHHPDFCVHYRDVDVTLYTHAVGGLSENDFILAAKISEAFSAP